MKLYELTEEIELAEQQIEIWASEHEGDITDCPFEEILGGLKEEKEKKLFNLGVWYKNMISDSKAIKSEIVSLSARKKALENKSQRIKNYLFENLEKGEKVSDARISFSWRKSESLVIDCETKDLPEEYQKITIEPKKAELKKFLKLGNEMEDVSIETKTNLQIN